MTTTEKRQKRTISVDELCQILGIGRNLAYKGLRDGSIPGMQIRSKWLISEERINKMLTGERGNGNGSK